MGTGTINATGNGRSRGAPGGEASNGNGGRGGEASSGNGSEDGDDFDWDIRALTKSEQRELRKDRTLRRDSRWNTIGMVTLLLQIFVCVRSVSQRAAAHDVIDRAR